MSTVTQEQPRLKFENYIPESRGIGYLCPNEDVGVWRELVKGKRIRRAAGICSGGEVGLFALLPTVRDELVLIDHNWESLYYAMTKYLLLREWGFAGFMRLTRDAQALRAAIEAVEKELPEGIRDAKSYIDRNNHARERLLKGATNTDPYASGVSTGNTFQMQWGRVRAPQRKALGSKLDKVQFVCGDFDALDHQGKFDLLYMSNAHECGNGNTRHKDLARISRCLNPGAYVLSSLRIEHHKYIPAVDSWKLIQSIHHRDVGMNRWSYSLYQVS